MYIHKDLFKGMPSIYNVTTATFAWLNETKKRRIKFQQSSQATKKKLKSCKVLNFISLAGNNELS